MRTIHAPLPDLARAERLPACKEALEAALWQVIDRAKAAGWSGTEATLASALVLADLADAESATHAAVLCDEATHRKAVAGF